MSNPDFTHRVLSIDVGIKNLSYCLFAINNERVEVLDWRNVSLLEGNTKKTKLNVLTECMLTALMDIFDDEFVVDMVLIENQPMLKNGMMKTMSVVIYTYFNFLKVRYGKVKEVAFMSASNKLKCRKVQLCEEANNKKQTYKDRKKLSVELCKLYLPVCCPERIEWFDKQSKRDDYSDCILQGIYYIESTLRLAL